MILTHQGIREKNTNGSRVIFRLSGTAGSGATVRMYLEKYVSARTVQEQGEELPPTREALKDLVDVAFQISKIVEITGFASPTVIT